MVITAFPCAVKVYSDGTWYCAVCDLRGDKDENPDDYCHKKHPPEHAPPYRK